MKGIIIAAIAAGAFAASGAAMAQEDLAKASGCLNCHSVDAQEDRAGVQGRRGQVQGSGRGRRPS